MRQLGGARRDLIVLGNGSVVERWEEIHTYAGDESLSFWRLDAPPKDLAILNRQLTERLEALRELARDGQAAELELLPLSSVPIDKAGHRDLADNPSYGVMFTLRAGGATRTLAITSDLPGIPAKVRWNKAWKRALAADMVVCHLSTIPLTELRQMARLLDPPEPFAEDVKWLNKMVKSDAQRLDRFRYAYWLEGADGYEVKPVGDQRGLAKWRVPNTHPYLGGLLRLAREFVSHGGENGHQRLFVIGELSEELGSFRARIAWQLNHHIFQAPACHALTGDIGLRVVLKTVTHPASGQGLAGPVGVLCSICELDNDLAPVETYHNPDGIVEVCVKGENEGIFYTCSEHDPTAAVADPVFLEKLERYDLFGR